MWDVIPSGDERDAMLRAYAAHLRAVKGRAKRTAADYAKDARWFLEFLDRRFAGVNLSEVSSDHVATWLVDMEEAGLAPATRRRRALSLRSFFTYALPNGTSNPAGDVSPPPAPRVRTDVFTDEEVDTILRYAGTLTSDRDQVVYVGLSIFRYGGLRLSEVANLRLVDVDMHGRRIRVLGKGDKERRVPVRKPLQDVLEWYLDHLRLRLPGAEYLLSNPLSQPAGQWHGRINPWVLAGRVRAIGEEAGVSSKTNPHKWRHTFATSAIRKGVDISATQQMMGHADISMTLRYVHLNDDDLRDALDRAYDEA